ncbi:MAG: nucleotidyltransferase domain-containing protein [Deferribacteres bacterium]|nr:nucleotidyltransferase domain-containing protein [Deferribacteres bacterium]
MKENEIVKTVLKHYPQVQAVYLFGTCGTEDERPGSDIDIAMLLPPAEAVQTGSLLMSDLWLELERLLKKEVDLINLRMVNTVFQKEIISAGRRIYCADEYAADEFEMLVLSYYQKLNEERAEILKEALKSGRFHNV